MKLNDTPHKKIYLSNVTLGFIIIIYKLTLDYIYYSMFVPVYSYFFSVGFHFDLGKYIFTILSLLMMIRPMLALLKRGSGSSMIILLLSLVYFIPGATIYALGDLSNNFYIFFTLYWYILVFLQLLLPRIKGVDVKGIRSSFLFNLIIISFSILIVVLSGIYTGFRINLSLANVYDLRLEAREFSMPTIVQYLMGASYIIIPLGTMHFIVKKKWAMLAILIFVQLISFSFNGKKSVLFTIFVIILIAKFYHKHMLRMIIPAFLGVNLVAILEKIISYGDSFMVKYIHRRVFFTPPILAEKYFSFFSNNELDYLRQSVLRWFGADSPYSVPIPRLIGYHYFNNIENNANTGMIGDAFSNFGWLGLLYPILIIIALRIFDKASENLNSRIIALMWILIFYKFINGTFFSILLTGGFILTCIVLVLCPREVNIVSNIGKDNNYEAGTNKK